MPADAPAFGRRRAALAAAPRPAPSPPPAGDDLGPEARRLLAEIAAETALGAPAADDLRDWKRAHRNRVWSGAGPWKYWACILGVLSFAGEIHDFGAATEPVTLVLRALGSACAVMGFWLGLKNRNR